MSFDGWPEDYRLVTAPLQGGRMVDRPMELPVITRGLWVPCATDLTVVMKEGMNLTFMQAQGLMPLRHGNRLARGTPKRDRRGMVGIRSEDPVRLPAPRQKDKGGRERRAFDGPEAVTGLEGVFFEVLGA